MEFQKDLGMFHIEGGSMKTAGKGNLGVLDYYKMENIISDTKMRDGIAGSAKKDE